MISLGEGSTPLLARPALSERLGVELWLKWEASNPTGSYKDRGMTVAVSKAVEDGAEAVICASTGNTAASAAAYAARAGIPAVVLTPEGAVAGAKVAQTRMLGARVLEVRGDFDEALAAAQELARRGTHVLVNSVNPYRREGQKTAVFEIVEELGAPPDAFVIPYGGGGNTSAYAAGIGELGISDSDLLGEAEHRPTTLASAIRIGDPVHAESVRASGATIVTVSDDEIVAAWLELATVEGLFCEPSSAAGLAAIRRGAVPGERLVVTITGHGLKDTESADRVRAAARAGRRRPRRDRRRCAPADDVVRAPATSANIGAGFDTAAVAFDLWNELEVTDGEGVVVEGEGACELAADDDQPRRPRVCPARRPGRQALPLRQPDPPRARARLVGRRDRARARRGSTGRDAPRSCSPSG